MRDANRSTRQPITNMKMPSKKIRVIAGALFAACLMTSCGGGTSKKIQGKWVIQEEPSWVKRNYLSWRSDTWTFLPDGICSLGKASGVYSIEESGRIKVMLSMQEATPGFTGLFEPTFSGNSLTMKNLTEEDPVVLTRLPE